MFEEMFQDLMSKRTEKVPASPYASGPPLPQESETTMADMIVAWLEEGIRLAMKKHPHVMDIENNVRDLIHGAYRMALIDGYEMYPDDDEWASHHVFVWVEKDSKPYRWYLDASESALDRITAPVLEAQE